MNEVPKSALDLRAPRRMLTALCVVAAPLLVGVIRAVTPTVNGDDGDVVVRAFAGHLAAARISFVACVLATITLPFFILGLYRLAVRGSAALGGIGAVLALIGWAMLPVLTAQDVLAYELARHGGDPVVWDRFSDNPTITLSIAVFVVAHELGMILLGIALRRCDAVPRWAGGAIVIGTAAHLVGVVSGIRLVDVAGFALVVAGSASAARVIASTTDEQELQGPIAPPPFPDGASTRGPRTGGVSRAALASTVVLSTMGAVTGAATGGSRAGATSSSAASVSATVSTAGSVAKDAVDITMTEYAFAVSGPLKSGGTVRMRNTGNELHMLGIGRIATGKTLADVRKALEVGGPEALARVVQQISLPGAIVPPGHAVEITVPSLSAGTYALLCFMPTEGSSLPHTAHGMVAELTVVAAKATPPKPDAVYTVAASKPIAGPATLKAGHRILQIDALPGTDALEIGIAPAPKGETLESSVARVDAQFGRDGGLAKGGSAAIAKILEFSGFDFGPDRRVSIGIDLKPGRYVLGAPDTDLQTPPRQRVEQIAITVR